MSPFFSSALDTKLKRRVAVKKLTRAFDTSELAKRSYRELRILKHMKHENVSQPVLHLTYMMSCALFISHAVILCIVLYRMKILYTALYIVLNAYLYCFM